MYDNAGTMRLFKVLNSPSFHSCPGAVATRLPVSVKSPAKARKSGKFYCTIRTCSKPHAVPDQALLRPAKPPPPGRLANGRVVIRWLSCWRSMSKATGAVRQILLRPAEAAALACLTFGGSHDRAARRQSYRLTEIAVYVDGWRGGGRRAESPLPRRLCSA